MRQSQHRATLVDIARIAHTEVNSPGGVTCQACGRVVQPAYRAVGGDKELCRSCFWVAVGEHGLHQPV